MATQDAINGFLLAKLLTPAAFIDPLTMVIGIVLAAVIVGVAFFLCWDLGKQTISDLAKIGWIIIFFILPVYSWIAYWLLIRRG